MKALVLVSIFVCLLNTTSGLKCYKCDDYILSYATHGKYQNGFSDYGGESCDVTNKTTECHPSDKFCLTYHDIDHETNPFCFAKGCAWLKLCESVETEEIVHPTTDEKVQVSCCQDDLCNSPKQNENINFPSSDNQLSNQSCLFYALFSSFFSTLLFWF